MPPNYVKSIGRKTLRNSEGEQMEVDSFGRNNLQEINYTMFFLIIRDLLVITERCSRKKLTSIC